MVIDPKLLTREILLGFWKVHILHHAAEHPLVGQWTLRELRRHGYDISPGTLYPLLKRMERNGWLRCEPEAGGGAKGRRYYHLTPAGVAVLDVLRENVVELHREVVEEADGHGPAPSTRLAPGAKAPPRAAQRTGKTRRAAGAKAATTSARRSRR